MADARRLYFLMPWIGTIGILVLWQLISTSGLIEPKIFPAPTTVIEAGFVTIPLPRLLEHIGISLLRVTEGFTLGAALGILLGITTGWYSRFGNIIRAPIELLRPIPPLAWIPLAIIWLGLGEASKVLIIFFGAFFPIFTNTYKGMLNLDPILMRAGQALGLRGHRLLMQVAIPATAPDIAIALRIGFTYAFGAMVAAELINSKSGLGYLIMNARDFGQIAVVMFGILMIGCLSLAIDFLLQWLIGRRLRWMRVS
jgi:ABC-type nitrate/sulfonate/bicarbonate transport system permease component